ncbi:MULTISPECIES: hypothetical protein [unclassified Streptomyces]|uniref:hypothetical protein n=1 Tax=unclassified Streptomyces TaxID=2593676 RepID=UPI000F6BDB09|nr:MULTISPECIES: hypothetical protein [unclassified Streptomyces]AZM59302.1 hypothetical protein DLM49_06765 [Streptomyces sp. WAC 01438]RSM94194.1 hypothetical protein DMA10_19875 [Streptomyces sp. WAC 01420]
MKHRGRHRRRRRGRALRAALAGTALGLTAAATLISASQATDADDPGALRPLTASAQTAPLRLTEEDVPDDALDRLAGAMGRPVGVGAVLSDPDGALRDAEDCSEDERRALPVEPAATRAYCWPGGDTEGWRAGAVTTSGDADEDGRWGRHRVILSGWSRATGSAAEQGLARVAFVNADEAAGPHYTWALLAVPVDGGRDYRGLGSAVSGMVWYQDKLLVTTGRGEGGALYVYDLDRVQRATVEGTSVGRVPGGWSAAGARYVLPAVASYRTSGVDAPQPGGISLDRSTAPDSLVAHEARPAEEDGPTRLWRYAFSTEPERAGLLETDPVAVYETELTRVRSVLAYRSGWYLGRMTGSSPQERGTLWRQDTEGALPTRCGADETHRCWSGAATSLSYWQETGDVWSQSGRMLFALPLASVDRSLDR